MLKNRKLLIAGLAACLLPGLSGAAAQASPTPTTVGPTLQANILIVTSHKAIEKWVMSAPDARRGDAGRIRTLAPGNKIFVPVVVTGAGAESTRLSADFEFVAPDGKVILSAKKCCSAARGDPKTPGVVVLNPVLDLTPEAGDPLGTYGLRAAVTDGTSTWTANESFVLAKAGVAAGAPAAAPAPRHSRGDARKCLEHSSDAAVRRCAEKYR